jgi:hypothetical protein
VARIVRTSSRVDIVSLAQAPPETGVLDVSVVLPCYNERNHVELGVKRIWETP